MKNLSYPASKFSYAMFKASQNSNPPEKLANCETENTADFVVIIFEFNPLTV